MRIAYYMPFKPLGHSHPSGDLVMGTGLYTHLKTQGHDIRLASRFCSRLLYLRPWEWPHAALSMTLAKIWARDFRPDVWLTYHAYYKGPDLLGPFCAKALNIPYVIFQGAYATKHRKRPLHRAGFFLNRHALLAADMVVCNKKRDYLNCRRIIPKDRLRFLRPGLNPDEFVFSQQARELLRSRLAPDNTPLIICTAMLRNDVKSQGVAWMLNALSQLAGTGQKFRLIIAGDGIKRQELERLGHKLLGERCSFLGKIPRRELFRYYSAADLFVFPGIRESFGMAYLEAQSCSLPVVAFHGWGVPEAVQDKVTGLLCSPFDQTEFNRHVQTLLNTPDLRRIMGQQAAERVRAHHDHHRNMDAFTTALLRLHTRYSLQRI